MGDVAGERCCWKQGKTPKLGLFDCEPGGVSCSPFLSLDFIVVVVSESSSFVCRALLLSRLRRLYRLSLDRQVPLVSSRRNRRTCHSKQLHTFRGSRFFVHSCRLASSIHHPPRLDVAFFLHLTDISDNVFSSPSQPKPFSRSSRQCRWAIPQLPCLHGAHFLSTNRRDAGSVARFPSPWCRFWGQ